MSVSYVCDRCGEPIPIGGPVPGIHLEVSSFLKPRKDEDETVWFFQSKAVDFCSKACLMAHLEEKLEQVEVRPKLASA